MATISPLFVPASKMSHVVRPPPLSDLMELFDLSAAASNNNNNGGSSSNNLADSGLKMSNKVKRIKGSRTSRLPPPHPPHPHQPSRHPNDNRVFAASNLMVSLSVSSGVVGFYFILFILFYLKKVSVLPNMYCINLFFT